jgi:hypothetical protein
MRSKAPIVFIHSNAGIVGSVASGLTTGSSAAQGILPNVCTIYNFHIHSEMGTDQGA